MTTMKTSMLFLSGVAFFSLGIFTFLHFFYHPQTTDVKGIAIKRELSVTPLPTQKVTPTTSPSPTLIVSPSIVKSKPIEQAVLPKKIINSAPSSNVITAHWAEGTATMARDDDPSATDSAASSSAETTEGPHVHQTN